MFWSEHFRHLHVSLCPSCHSRRHIDHYNPYTVPVIHCQWPQNFTRKRGFFSFHIFLECKTTNLAWCWGPFNGNASYDSRQVEFSLSPRLQSFSWRPDQWHTAESIMRYKNILLLQLTLFCSTDDYFITSGNILTFYTNTSLIPAIATAETILSQNASSAVWFENRMMLNITQMSKTVYQENQESYQVFWILNILGSDVLHC